jgi:murein DD-endopeptidase MepM/ murein hydrolase activator NlpD
MRKTQLFGNDFKVNGKLYYKSMGIKGHDGLDAVPQDRSDLRIYNFFPGIVILKFLHKVYGNRIAIWNPETNLIEYHNHLSEFNFDVKIGDIIEARTLLGKMGKTGKVFGAHDHIAFAESDESGKRINRTNGYFGYIDPVPILKAATYDQKGKDIS